MSSVLSAKHFHDEAAAFAFVEKRVWPNGPVCPHCGGVERIGALKGKSTRLGTYKCYQCRKPFTVKVGTVFESSHIPMHIWLQGIALLSSSKKGISTNQLHRILGITLKAAWFMSHRIREAMRSGSLAPMGGSGGIVEADETYIGKRKEKRTMRTSGQPFIKGGKAAQKLAVISLVERGGSVRSFHVENADKATVNNIVRDNIAREACVHTDESRIYNDMRGNVASHDTVKHSVGEYVRYEPGRSIHTNTVEGVFSILKRGMVGVYQHCAEKHLHRYLAEFDFRYNHRIALGVNDTARADAAIKGIVGKRLTYRAVV
ncbi:MAG: IS1595 family transposase [Bauldia sp.]|nr:IS1595 family transposase [Bauldia sp.]